MLTGGLSICISKLLKTSWDSLDALRLVGRTNSSFSALGRPKAELLDNVRFFFVAYLYFQ